MFSNSDKIMRDVIKLTFSKQSARIRLKIETTHIPVIKISSNDFSLVVYFHLILLQLFIFTFKVMA